MDFECFVCEKQFENIKNAIAHLKRDHLIVDNTLKMQCLVRYDNEIGCSKYYRTLSSLRKHVTECIKSKKVNLPAQVIFLNFIHCL